METGLPTIKGWVLPCGGGEGGWVGGARSRVCFFSVDTRKERGGIPAGSWGAMRGCGLAYQSIRKSQEPWPAQPGGLFRSRMRTESSPPPPPPPPWRAAPQQERQTFPEPAAPCSPSCRPPPLTPSSSAREGNGRAVPEQVSCHPQRSGHLGRLARQSRLRFSPSEYSCGPEPWRGWGWGGVKNEPARSGPG